MEWLVAKQRQRGGVSPSLEVECDGAGGVEEDERIGGKSEEKKQDAVKPGGDEELQAKEDQKEGPKREGPVPDVA